MEQIIYDLGQLAWGWPTMVLFVGVGVLFTVRLRCLQVRKLGLALRCVMRPQEGDGISPYSALCTALAATIGTGNIVGVATAMTAGGPGALLWMLIAAFFGMATQYAEGYLAVRYRKKTKDGWFGGPFCYIEMGLRKQWLAKLFAGIGALVGLLGVGTLTQVNSITNAVDGFFQSETLFAGQSAASVLSGALVTLASACVLLGGVKRIAKVCETLVPIMSALYLFCAAVLLFCHARELPSAITLIVKSAFAPRAVLGAGVGIGLKQVLRMGIGRGVLTNEAGVGSSPIAAAASNETDPIRQGLVSMTGTFIDTIVICTVTGLCLTVTQAWKLPMQGVQISDASWRMGLPWAQSLSSFLLMLCLVFFAFATILGWNFYAERCLCYLTGGQWRKLYRFAYLAAIAIAPYVTVGVVWELADIMNAMMALPNLTALLLLQNEVVHGTRKMS